MIFWLPLLGIVALFYAAWAGAALAICERLGKPGLAYFLAWSAPVALAWWLKPVNDPDHHCGLGSLAPSLLMLGLLFSSPAAPIAVAFWRWRAKPKPFTGYQGRGPFGDMQ